MPDDITASPRFAWPLRREGNYLVDAHDIIRLQAPGIHPHQHAAMLDFVCKAVNDAVESRGPTADELSAILGPSWGVCRATARNRARYARCISAKEYKAACAEALRRRGDHGHRPDQDREFKERFGFDRPRP